MPTHRQITDPTKIAGKTIKRVVMDRYHEYQFLIFCDGTYFSFVVEDRTDDYVYWIWNEVPGFLEIARAGIAGPEDFAAEEARQRGIAENETYRERAEYERLKVKFEGK